MALSCPATDTHFLVVRISEAAAAQNKLSLEKNMRRSGTTGFCQKIPDIRNCDRAHVLQVEKLATQRNSTIPTPELSGDQIAEGGSARKIRYDGWVNILDGRFARLAGAWSAIVGLMSSMICIPRKALFQITEVGCDGFNL
jgi:hypothetical protein